MTVGRRLALAVLLAATVTAVAPPAFADRAAADFFSQRGDKSVKEKKWAEAQEHFRKAIEEDEGHVPARVGLGEAFFGAGDRGAAVEAWRLAVAKADATKPLPPGWADAAARARKRLLEIDAAGTALAQIVDKQVEDLVALAERWLAKDPDVAALAARDALKLRPAHAKAAALAAKFGPAPAEWTQLFDGKSYAGWGEPDTAFYCQDGVILGDVKTGTVGTDNETKTFQGNFDVRVEAKTLEERSTGQAIFAVGAALWDKNLGIWLGVGHGTVSLQDHTANTMEGVASLFDGRVEALPHPFDTLEWTTYELQFRGKEIHVLVNGQEEFVRERPKGRIGGNVGLLAQSVRVAVRKVEAIQR